MGASTASFYGDTFTKCVGITGGAIAAIDFMDMTIDNCKFGDNDALNNILNVAFSGRGENIFA